MNTQDRKSFGSEKDENYGCGRSGQPGVALGSVPAPLPVPWHAIAGLSHVLGGSSSADPGVRRAEMGARRFGTTVVEELGAGSGGDSDDSHADGIEQA